MHQQTTPPQPIPPQIRKPKIQPIPLPVLPVLKETIAPIIQAIARRKKKPAKRPRPQRIESPQSVEPPPRSLSTFCCECVDGLFDMIICTGSK